MRRRPFVFGTLAAAAIAGSIPGAAVSAQRHLVVTGTRVGPFTLERSTRRQILHSFGRPGLRERNAAGYDCNRKGCRTKFFFATRGGFSGRLMGVVLTSDSRGFRTSNGTKIGMSASEARRRERRAMSTRVCGTGALRYPAKQGVAGFFSGLNIFLRHGRVASFVVMSPHEPVRCLPGGGFEPG